MNNNAIAVIDQQTKRHVIIPVREVLMIQETDTGHAVISCRSNKMRNIYTESTFQQVLSIYQQAIQS